MNINNRWVAKLSLVLLGSALAFAHLPQAQAQAAWPSAKPIRLVVVFPPGGSVDQVARLLAPVLQQQLNQTIVVENLAGASGAIGTATVARAEGDGYTIGMVFDTHAVNPSLIPNMGFDTKKDIANVTLIGTAPMALVASKSSGFNSFKDVLDASNAKKPINYGTIGSGSLGHLAMTLLGKGAGYDWQHVPYRGGGPLITDALGGHVPLAIGSVFLVKPQVDAKNLIPLAVTTSKRSPDLPNVPTMAESGFSGFEAPAWWGVIAPGKTPPELVRRIHDEIAKALKNPALAKKLDEQGIDILAGNPEVMRRFVEKQMEIWDKVVKDNQIKAGS